MAFASTPTRARLSTLPVAVPPGPRCVAAPRRPARPARPSLRPTHAWPGLPAPRPLAAPSPCGPTDSLLLLHGHELPSVAHHRLLDVFQWRLDGLPSRHVSGAKARRAFAHDMGNA